MSYRDCKIQYRIGCAFVVQFVYPCSIAVSTCFVTAPCPSYVFTPSRLLVPLGAPLVPLGSLLFPFGSLWLRFCLAPSGSPLVPCGSLWSPFVVPFCPPCVFSVPFRFSSLPFGSLFVALGLPLAFLGCFPGPVAPVGPLWLPLGLSWFFPLVSFGALGSLLASLGSFWFSLVLLRVPLAPFVCFGFRFLPFCSRCWIAPFSTHPEGRCGHNYMKGDLATITRVAINS